ncbi:hypothetical protein Pint_10676 [Pistacia integerrima]|uniref:Uncharacterized protein n=1 Tax=Pistacia integerrima TaxID=434235 RepID=A0ACC0XEW0_9ROSI|nr:hypothetical protein Pint_10676 [Pistacia integerrima]
MLTGKVEKVIRCLKGGPTFTYLFCLLFQDFPFFFFVLRKLAVIVSVLFLHSLTLISNKEVIFAEKRNIHLKMIIFITMLNVVIIINSNNGIKK